MGTVLIKTIMHMIKLLTTSDPDIDARYHAFRRALFAIDGTHIPMLVAAAEIFTTTLQAQGFKARLNALLWQTQLVHICIPFPR